MTSLYAISAMAEKLSLRSVRLLQPVPASKGESLTSDQMRSLRVSLRSATKTSLLWIMTWTARMRKSYIKSTDKSETRTALVGRTPCQLGSWRHGFMPSRLPPLKS